MSECVVRMEMPKSCKNCHFRFHMYCGLAKKDIFPEYVLLENRPYWCSILCQLPEGHGRLVDADALRDEWLYETGTFEPNDVLDSIDYAPTIVPATNTPTNTQTDTPTVPAERSET